MRVFELLLSRAARVWAKIDQWLIADHLKGSRHTLYKARILASVQLFLVVIIGVSYLTTVLFTPENTSFSLTTSLAIFICLAFLFKKVGNMRLSGNLLAVGMAAILAPMVLVSGGLYSDNLLWMLLCPLVVMLFGAKVDVVFWLLGICGFIVYLFNQDIANPGIFKLQIAGHTPDYYMIGYTLLFTAVVLVVFLFKIGEESIINDLRENKEALESQRQELILINQQLRQLSDHLQRSNRDLESFAYAASHDLKEPLRMIGSYTQLVQKRLASVITPDTAEMMTFVRQGVEKMQRLLEDLLEYSRIGRGQDKMKEIDLDDVFFYVKSALKLRIEETSTTVIEEKHLPQVYGRYSEMVQLFQNLVSNAIKFRKPDVPPEIRITWVELRGFYTFSLSDNGIGIEKQHHNKVFDLFERLHGSHQYEGSGIGLATCKKIVQNLGGGIWVESTAGVGTTFFFTLPKTAQAYQQAMNSPESQSEELSTADVAQVAA